MRRQKKEKGTRERYRNRKGGEGEYKKIGKERRRKQTLEKERKSKMWEDRKEEKERKEKGIKNKMLEIGMKDGYKSETMKREKWRLESGEIERIWYKRKKARRGKKRDEGIGKEINTGNSKERCEGRDE